MSTGLIIAIVVAAVIVLIALLVLTPRMRERGRIRRRERLLEERRQQAAAEHRQLAETRAQNAEAGVERRARVAEQEARREHAEAELHRERAAASESGMADGELIGDEEHRPEADPDAGRGGRFRRRRLAANDREPTPRT